MLSALTRIRVHSFSDSNAIKEVFGNLRSVPEDRLENRIGIENLIRKQKFVRRNSYLDVLSVHGLVNPYAPKIMAAALDRSRGVGKDKIAEPP